MSNQITVLMSVYNDEKYLKESIESILKQSVKDFEFLIFEDCSTDNSRIILKEYEKKDKRIKLVLNTSNKGLSFNLAKGVLMAKNEWIARMDADDIALKERFSLQLDYIKKHPKVDVLGGYVIDIDENGLEKGIRKVPLTHNKISSLIWTCPFIHPTVIYRKKSILEAGSYNKDLRRRQDYDLWFRCHKMNLEFANLDVPLIYYRATDDYYKKNDYTVQLNQVKLGFKGAFLVKSSPIAYIGITVAFFKGILPIKLRKPISIVFRKIDPRQS